VQVIANNITLQKVYNAKPLQVQLIDQPWQQSLSLSNTKQLPYNCSNPLILTLVYLPTCIPVWFLLYFFKATLWLKSVRVRNMQEKKQKRQMMNMQGQKRVSRYRRRHSLTNLQAGAPWFEMHFLSLLLKGKMIMLTLHKLKDQMPKKTAPKSFKLRPTTSQQIPGQIWGLWSPSKTPSSGGIPPRETVRKFITLS
jgi:hypothetical protein